MSEGQFLETKESEPKHNIVMVDFLRHGATEYQEDSVSTEDREAMAGNYPRDLTAIGEKQIEATAEEIIKTIDPSRDVVVLWSSPAWRAQGSEEILKNMLEQGGIEVYKDSAIDSMRNFDQHDKTYMDEVWQRIAPTDRSAELIYARDPEFQTPNEKFESQPEVKKRAERVFNWIRYLAEHAELEPGKRLRVIGVSHFEFLNPMMEDLFGPKVETGEGVAKGEPMRVTFDYDQAGEGMKISADFRGEHKEAIAWDKETRHFVSSE